MKALLLIFGLAILSAQATAQSIIYKCVKDGKTTYGQSPCRPNAYQENRVDINTDMVGTVDPDRETIEASRRSAVAPVRTTTVTTRRTTSRTKNKEIACDGIAQQIKNIEASQRNAHSGSWQDNLTQQKRAAQSRQSDLGC